MTQPTYFDRPLSDAVEALTEREQEIVRDALAILGPYPTEFEVRQHFERVTSRTTTRGRLKRVFWSMVPDTRGMDGRPRPLTAQPSDRMLAVGHRCVYCGAPAEAVDHVWPRSRGGDDHPNNLVRACKRCNLSKSGSSILGDPCPSCGHERHPSDVDTATGRAFYACRCGSTWFHDWNLQAVPFDA